MYELTKREAEQELLESLPITKQLEAKGTKYEVHNDGIYLPDYDVLLDEETGEEIKMTDYSKLSDFEINKLVAKLLLKDENHFSTWVANSEAEVWFVDESNGNSVINFNPCNNPSDAWPIIVDNNISIENRKNKTTLAWVENDAPYPDDNPLRAAMIVYLMMNESNG